MAGFVPMRGKRGSMKKRVNLNEGFYQNNVHVMDNAMRDFEKPRRAHAVKVEKNPEIMLLHLNFVFV